MFSSSLESTEYIILRNSIIVLARIIDYFPRDKRSMLDIESKVVLLIETEQREDIKTMAMNYAAKLKRKKRLNPAEFGDPKAKAAAAAAKSNNNTMAQATVKGSSAGNREKSANSSNTSTSQKDSKSNRRDSTGRNRRDQFPSKSKPKSALEIAAEAAAASTGKRKLTNDGKPPELKRARGSEHANNSSASGSGQSSGNRAQVGDKRRWNGNDTRGSGSRIRGEGGVGGGVGEEHCGALRVACLFWHVPPNPHTGLNAHDCG